MAEACIVSHAESRRCLPAWMLKACSSNEVAKTDRNVQALEFDKQPGALDQIKPVKRKSGRRLKSVDAEDAGELGVLQRCQGREKVRRKSKDADHAVTDELEEIEKVTSKNVRKASRRAAPKNSRKRKLENVGSGASPSETTDDEIELTVEDLVSIAEEVNHNSFEFWHSSCLTYFLGAVMQWPLQYSRSSCELNCILKSY